VFDDQNPTMRLVIEQDGKVLGESSTKDKNSKTDQLLASAYASGHRGVISGLAVIEGGPVEWENIRWTVNSI
jgi:hypothetical protein